MKKTHLLLVFLLLFFSLYAQNQEWINYAEGEIIHSIAIEGNYIWAGSTNGLIKLNKTTGELTFYNKTNSSLPDNYVQSIVIDESGNKWIGTIAGLAKFDGTNWTVFNPSNSGLPGNAVASIAIDGNGNKWIGTLYGGLAKFDDTTWTVFDPANSGLPDYYVWCIAIDSSGNKWIGTKLGGLAKYDDTTWAVYNSTNSGLPWNYILSIAIDGNGNKWIGASGGMAKFDDATLGGTGWTAYDYNNSGLPNNWVWALAIDGSENKWIGTFGGGLAKFDGSTWATYSANDSTLPNNYVQSLAIDGSGNKWIGTSDGLSVYNEGGVISFGDGVQILPENFLIHQNYPNPFNPTTTIRYSISQENFVSIKVYNLLGEEVAALVNDYKLPGSYNIIFNAASLSSGVYFYKISAGEFSENKKMVLLR